MVSYSPPKALVFSKHRTVVGSQQRTMGPTVSVRDRHLPPAPLSYGPSTSTSPQTYDAPVGPHTETSRQSGSASRSGSRLMANPSFEAPPLSVGRPLILSPLRPGSRQETMAWRPSIQETMLCLKFRQIIRDRRASRRRPGGHPHTHLK